MQILQFACSLQFGENWVPNPISHPWNFKPQCSYTVICTFHQQYLQQYISRWKSFASGFSLGKWQGKKMPWMTLPPVQIQLAQFLCKTWCAHKVMVASCYTNVQQSDSKGYMITLLTCYPGNNLSLGRRCILIQETEFKSLGITSWSCLPFCLNFFNKTLALTLGCTKSKYDLCFLLIISSEGTL